MKRRAIVMRKCKILYRVSIALAALCGIAVYGAMSVADLENGSLLPIFLFLLAAIMCVLAAKGFKRRILQLMEEEMKFLSRDLNSHLQREFYK